MRLSTSDGLALTAVSATAVGDEPGTRDQTISVVEAEGVEGEAECGDAVAVRQVSDLGPLVGWQAACLAR